MLLVLLLLTVRPSPSSAQIPSEGEVRQLVTFRFLPGRAQEALDLYRSDAIPLYRQDEAMLSFRGLREVESPIPLDLVVISAFQSMSGMDDSNAMLRRLAESRGSSIGAIYGAIGALSSSHDDQFIEMLPRLGDGDPASRRLVALVWYRVAPGEESDFEQMVAGNLVSWEARRGIRASTGRFLLSDDWTHLRMIGFESLGDYHKYWSDLRLQAWARTLTDRVQRHRQVILAVLPDFSVR